jgi:DNA helicase HerA-like ATPase
MARLKGMKPGTPASKKITKLGGHLTAPKEYRKGGATKRGAYADPSRFKYPVDTVKHARAAMSYFSKPKNHGMYSSSERKAIARRIARAARKFGITISSDSAILSLAGEKGPKKA